MVLSALPKSFLYSGLFLGGFRIQFLKISLRHITPAAPVLLAIDLSQDSK